MLFLYKLLIFAPPLLVAVILHEVAHGYIADKLGDPTARLLGRITLNPIKHIDPFMTIILPFALIMIGSPFLFGGAKPVPVNPLRFKNPIRDMAYVAIAGPLTNFSLATVCWFVLKQLSIFMDLSNPASLAISLIVAWLHYGFMVNIVLGLFNLFPIPPLDGGRILVGILPEDLARTVSQIEPYDFSS